LYPFFRNYHDLVALLSPLQPLRAAPGGIEHCMTVSDLTNQIMIPESGMIGQHQNKGFSFFSALFSPSGHTQLALLIDFIFTWLHLGACSQATMGKEVPMVTPHPEILYSCVLVLTCPAFPSNSFCTISSAKCLTQICEMF